jgi:GT2 family glycosyltransferase
MVSVIIPHLNRREDLRRCLQSLQTQTFPHEVLVVDNGSRDGSVEMLAAEFPSIQVQRCGRNLGFAEAINLGMELGLEQGADFFLLLNNDAVLDSQLLQSLVSFARQGGNRGLVAPNIYYLEEPQKLWSAGGRINLTRGCCQQLTEEKKVPNKVDYASGCVLLAKADLVRDIGFLDGRFFMYYEEVDWCLRARAAGFEVWHLPQAKAWHAVSSTLGENSAALQYYMARNHLLLLKKHGRPALVLRVLLGEYLRALAVARIRKDRRRAQALQLAVSDFLRGRFGEKPLSAFGPNRSDS